MSYSDDAHKSTSEHPDSIVPTDTDGEVLSWETENDATLLGLMYEIGKYCVSEQHHQSLLENDCYQVGRTLAVASAYTVLFVNGQAQDPPHPYGAPTNSFERPCPPMLGPAGRLARCNAWRAMQTPPQVALVEPTAAEVAAAGCQVLPYVIKERQGKLLKMLKSSFGKVDSGRDLINAANGCGRDLINAIMARGRAANRQDKAAVMARYQRVIRQAVPGELRLDPFNVFLKQYRRANRDVAPTSRQPADAEIEMINLIAYKDEGISDLYELKASAAPPASFEDAVTLVKSILRRGSAEST
jgi:hypothetical protein